MFHVKIVLFLNKGGKFTSVTADASHIIFFTVSAAVTEKKNPPPFPSKLRVFLDSRLSLRVKQA